MGRSPAVVLHPAIARRLTDPVRVVLVLLVSLTVAGCTTGATPALSASGSPAASEGACSPAASACPIPSLEVSPSPAPATSRPAPTAEPTASASTPASSPAVVSPCPIESTTLALASDRMIGIEVVLDANVDIVRFRFGPPTWQGSRPATSASIHLAPASPPYVADPSGLPLEVTGQRVVSIRMQGMWLYDDAGVPTYGGPARLDEPGPGLRSAVLAGAFEGYETWLIGFDGPGCLTVTLAADGSLEVRVTHQCGC